MNTNYSTVNDSEEGHPVAIKETNSNFIDFSFESGITYEDEIEFEFSMTVDSMTRNPGSGDEVASLLLVPVCNRNIIGQYPKDPDGTFDTQEQCGEAQHIMIKTTAPGWLTK